MAVSTLRSEGHPAAHHYAVGTVWRESDYVRRRLNMLQANSALALKVVANTIMGGKESEKELQDYLKRLTDE